MGTMKRVDLNVVLVALHVPGTYDSCFNKEVVDLSLISRVRLQHVCSICCTRMQHPYLSSSRFANSLTGSFIASLSLVEYQFLPYKLDITSLVYSRVQ